jgi:hypothetical protein
VRLLVQASSSVAVPSFSALAAPVATRRVLALRQALQASLQAAGPCILPALLLAVHRVDVPASVSARGAAVPALVPVLAVPVEPAEDWCLLQARHRVRSVLVVRHAAVGASSTPRPKKAR